ncbi:MAG: 16S rRNA (adenine(1518)-N(6)/adenine(1519)-N(6))-dimethyltransferase RsmA [Anaerolineae bacterium]
MGREELDRLGVEPKKSLGQNFMVEQAAIDAMVDAADIDPTDTVLEVGAGLGALTATLAERARRVVAVEIDQRLIPALRARFAGQPHVELHLLDILEADPNHLLGDEPYKVTANVPYYITSAIIRHLLENTHPPTLMVITIQKEEADRITAKPGDMSLLAVSVQFFGTARVVRKIGPSSFYPQPRVTSAVLRIDPHPDGPPIPIEQVPDFFRVVKAGFSQPRKQLKNTLASGLHTDTEPSSLRLQQAGIEPRRRPEKLSVAQWVRLYEAIHSHGA